MNRIFVITICWNEEQFLPFFLNHYRQIADRIIVFDNESTDETLNIIQRYNESDPKIEVRTYSTDNQIRDDIYLDIKNNRWREWREECEWVIIVDIDEILYHPDGLREYIEGLRDVALVQARGFEMFCPDFYTRCPPSPHKALPYDICRTGVAQAMMSKTCIINTKLVKNIHYLPGCHACFPEHSGTYVQVQSTPVRMLHYKFIYPFERMVERYRTYVGRLSAQNQKNGWGSHYKNIQKLYQKYIQYNATRQTVL